jgi:putative transposase
VDFSPREDQSSAIQRNHVAWTSVHASASTAMPKPSENWHLEPLLGFQGLREDLPVKIYGQSLPHWRQDGATYFVTFRLHDSLPQEKLQELRELQRELENLPEAKPGNNLTLRRLDESALTLMRQIEKWLDQSMGECTLRLPEVSAKVMEALHETDGARCELGCYVIMPNHVHAVVKPLHPRTDSLERILQSWKGISSRRINELLGMSGALWQRESFDRSIRDEEHLWRVIQYIGSNPEKAGLSPVQTRLWVRPDWIARGWGFETLSRVD